MIEFEFWGDVIFTLAVVVFAVAVIVIRRDTDDNLWKVAWLIGENRKLARRVRALEAAQGIRPVDVDVEPEPHRPRWRALLGWVRSLTVPDQPDEPAPPAETLPSPVVLRPSPSPRTQADDPEWRKRFGLG